MHVCTLWQVQFLTLYYRCSNPTTANHTHTPPYTHALANTCISTHLPAKHSHTSHINSLASVTAWVGVGSHMYMHAHTQTTHPETQTQSSCLQRMYPFDPLTGTWRISKWEEKPQSRSTSQRCALSIGSCLTPQDSRGWLCLLQEAITLLSGSEVCLECYLHLSWKEAGAQEVRQEWDHLYHVLCMTCGMCLNIYMCLKVMQIEREKTGKKFRQLCFLCRQRVSINSSAWCNSRVEPVTTPIFFYLLIRARAAYIRVCISVLKSLLTTKFNYLS